MKIYNDANTNNITTKVTTNSNNDKYKYNNIYLKERKEEKYKQSYSQDKTYFNHTLRTITDVSN